jgi:hypothetical protein
MDMATMVGLLAVHQVELAGPAVGPARGEVVRQEVGQRRRRADADVGEVRVLERLRLGPIRAEDDGLHVLHVERRHHHVGHRVRHRHVARQRLVDRVMQEGAVVLGSHQQAGHLSLSVSGTTTCGRVVIRMHPTVLIAVSKRTEELN